MVKTDCIIVSSKLLLARMKVLKPLDKKVSRSVKEHINKQINKITLLLKVEVVQNVFLPENKCTQSAHKGILQSRLRHVPKHVVVVHVA